MSRFPRVMNAMSRQRVTAAGLVTGIAALIVMIGLIGSYDPPYESTAEVLITPASISPDLAAATSDTLSRGTVVTTFALAYDSDTVVGRAIRASGIVLRGRDSVDVVAQAVAGSSVIRITATSSDADLARRAADAVVNYQPTLGGYSRAFRPSVLQLATAAERAGPSPGVLAVLAVALATGVGLVAARLARWAVRRGRPKPSGSRREAAADAATLRRPADGPFKEAIETRRIRDVGARAPASGVGDAEGATASPTDRSAALGSSWTPAPEDSDTREPPDSDAPEVAPRSG